MGGFCVWNFSYIYGISRRYYEILPLLSHPDMQLAIAPPTAMLRRLMRARLRGYHWPRLAPAIILLSLLTLSQALGVRAGNSPHYCLDQTLFYPCLFTTLTIRSLSSVISLASIFGLGGLILAASSLLKAALECCVFWLPLLYLRDEFFMDSLFYAATVGAPFFSLVLLARSDWKINPDSRA